MKLNFLVLGLMVMMFCACKDAPLEKVYVPRTLLAKEDFNHYAKNGEKPFNIVKITEGDASKLSEKGEVFSLKYRDTTVKILLNEADPKSAVDKFALAQFVNTQQTTLLVQVADGSGLVAPFFLVSLKDKKLDVVKLYRPSSGKHDKGYTIGMTRVGGTGWLINNDFFITTVNAKVYMLKRQNPEERIQGEFFIKSPDKQTFVFLMADGLYEVHYPSDENLTVPFSSSAPATKSRLFPWVQANFSWQKTKKGLVFLQENKDDNRIVDMTR
ncbi:hypothetical protein [Pedobacter sp.]|uniref:hypothetical protein n=1 Tax=Pedobacter sp. TaxID=1411316 RepID=UPI003D7F3C92